MLICIGGSERGFADAAQPVQRRDLTPALVARKRGHATYGAAAASSHGRHRRWPMLVRNPSSAAAEFCRKRTASI